MAPGSPKGNASMLEQMTVGLFLRHIVNLKPTIVSIRVEMFRLRTSSNQIQRETTMIKEEA